VRRRFERERQTLASLEHPHMAHVFDAGASEDRRPFFAMEFVAGLPITEHYDRERLGLAARLALQIRCTRGA
jgi:serine/threonine protein kinase